MRESTMKLKGIDSLIFGAMILFALTLQISIAVANAVWIFLLLLGIARFSMDRSSFQVTPLAKPILWLLAITFLATILAIDPIKSFKEWKQISLVTVFWLTINSISDETQLKKIVRTFVIAAVLVSLFGIFQYVLGINMEDNVIIHNPYPALQHWSQSVLTRISLDHGRAIGSRSHPLTFAECLMMALTFTCVLAVLAESKKQRFMYGMAVTIMGLALLFSNSRGPWLGAAAGICSIVFFKPSKKVIAVLLLLLILIPTLIAGVSFATKGKRNSVVERIQKAINWRSDGDSRERVLMWQSGLKMIKDHPWFGIGVGNIGKIYSRYKSPEAWHKGNESELHSNFVQIPVERGLFGLGAFVVLLAVFFREGYRAFKIQAGKSRFLQAVALGGIVSVISFLVAGLTETTYNDSEIIMLFYFMMGLTMWIRNKKKNPKDEQKIAVFMDRDGTISEEVGYINHPDRFRLLKRTAKAIKLLNKNNILAIVVTNQAGVGRGYFKEEMIGVVHKKMENLLAKSGAHLDAVYYCPHHPKDNCNCRKPKPGMLLAAKEKFGVDLTKSYVIGDKYSDVEFAHSNGAKGILVLTGYGKGAYEYEKEQWSRGPDYVAGDLYDAVEWVIKQSYK